MLRARLACQIVLVGKAPSPGHSKTRLSPPLTLDQAAEVAEALLVDSLAAASATPAARHVLALEGAPGAWLPGGWDVMPQRGSGLAERLARAAHDAYATCSLPLLLLPTDTAPLSPGVLESALEALLRSGVDAVLGLAEDGGWWALGLRAPQAEAFLGVPMSTPYTGRAQAQRLADLGLAVADLARLADVDVIEDLDRVRPLLQPTSALAVLLDSLGRPRDRCERQSASADGAPVETAVRADSR